MLLKKTRPTASNLAHPRPSIPSQHHSCLNPDLCFLLLLPLAVAASLLNVIPTVNAQVQALENDTMPFVQVPPYGEPGCFHSETKMLGHFFSTQGCYLCTRYPIPDSKVNDRYFRDVAFADPPYRTWAIDTGLDSQYLNDMAEAGLITDILDRWNANGGMVDDEWKNDPWPVNTPANITEKWERRPRIPCLCWGSVIAWHKMDLSIPPESGQDRCTNEFHWQMTSFDCRRVINNSGAGPLADLIVDPNLHCSDGGNSFNSIQIQPVPLPPGSFVPSQEQDPSPPTQPPIATAPPVSTAVDGPAPTDSNGGSVGGGSPPASATSTVAPGQPSTSATPIGGLDIGGGTGIVIGPGTGDGRSPPGGGVIPGGMGGGDSLGLDGSPGDGSPGGRNGNIGAGSAGLSNGKGGPSATTPGVNIPPSPSGTRSIPVSTQTAASAGFWRWSASWVVGGVGLGVAMWNGVL